MDITRATAKPTFALNRERVRVRHVPKRRLHHATLRHIVADRATAAMRASNPPPSVADHATMVLVNMGSAKRQCRLALDRNVQPTCTPIRLVSLRRCGDLRVKSCCLTQNSGAREFFRLVPGRQNAQDSARLLRNPAISSKPLLSIEERRRICAGEYLPTPDYSAWQRRRDCGAGRSESISPLAWATGFQARKPVREEPERTIGNDEL